MRAAGIALLSVLLAGTAAQGLESRKALAASSSPFAAPSPAAPQSFRHVLPSSARTPTIVLPLGGLPVTPECEAARERERWSTLPCGPGPSSRREKTG